MEKKKPITDDTVIYGGWSDVRRIFFVNQHGILRASQALGHSQITTTMQYYHEDADALKAAMTKQ